MRHPKGYKEKTFNFTRGSMAKDGTNRGRPPIVIDWPKVDSMCAIHCTGKEIAAILGCSYEGLEHACKRDNIMNLGDYIRQKSSNGKASLRRRQYKKAMDEGNTAMLIWLGKQWLGQTDRLEHLGDPTAPIKLAYDTQPQITRPKGDVIDVGNKQTETAEEEAEDMEG